MVILIFNIDEARRASRLSSPAASSERPFHYPACSWLTHPKGELFAIALDVDWYTSATRTSRRLFGFIVFFPTVYGQAAIQHDAVWPTSQHLLTFLNL
ncbi:hypothetical protein EYF80_033823 [Liparis tanakae]|uniref:Uncharacterized protein n=1 Tax=Liparis tanakae TaxID=230148 RepID=A0A4Z2GQN1_9TELE|nr:hypothetical protein EYF80_033823 [Liparis tanakae]